MELTNTLGFDLFNAKPDHLAVKVDVLLPEWAAPVLPDYRALPFNKNAVTDPTVCARLAAALLRKPRGHLLVVGRGPPFH